MKLKIFVIDDEECIRDSMKWYLEDLGHEVVTASEPTSCEVYQGHVCSQEAPCGDALIIDYHMPKMTGLEFIEMISQKGCKGLAANKFLMSGNITDICLKKVRELGCSIAQKPVEFGALESWLDVVKERKVAFPNPDKSFNCT